MEQNKLVLKNLEPFVLPDGTHLEVKSILDRTGVV